MSTPPPDKRLLSDRPILGFIGPFGVGKTEVAMSYAAASAAAGRATCLIDLDVITPYFRVGDYEEQMIGSGIRVIAPGGDLTKFDSPALSPEISQALASETTHSVLDVGGDAEGARLLGVYTDSIAAAGYDLWLVCNPFRPDVSSRTVAEQRLAIERSSGLRITGLVANPHLGPETDVPRISEGWSRTALLSKELDLRIVCIAVDECFADRVPSVEVPVLRLHLHVRLPWQVG